jgi:hypothetical protein
LTLQPRLQVPQQPQSLHLQAYADHVYDLGWGDHLVYRRDDRHVESGADDALLREA